MKALVLGWVTDLLKVILALRKAGIETVIVNTSPERFFEEVPALPEKIPVALNLYDGIAIPKLKLLRFFLVIHPYILGPSVRDKLTALVQKQKPDFVFAHWGVGVLPEIALIKSIKPSLPIILNMETFPTAPSGGLRESAELKIFSKMAWALDGLIIPTKEMADLLFSLVPSLEKKPHWVCPFYYPEEFSPKEIYPKLSANTQQPHVVFVGQFDLRHSINDVRQEIIALANAGICVHCARISGLNHPNIVMFEPFSAEELVSGQVTSWMTQFDACLVTYGTKAKPPLRFKTSLPSRFLIALVAGIPVLLPAGKFKAMENFVKNENIGLIYENPYEALYILKGDKLGKATKQALAHRNKFILRVNELRDFVYQVLGVQTA